MQSDLIKSGVVIALSLTLSACVVAPVTPVHYRPVAVTVPVYPTVQQPAAVTAVPVYVRPAPVVYAAPVYFHSRIYY